MISLETRDTGIWGTVTVPGVCCATMRVQTALTTQSPRYWPGRIASEQVRCAAIRLRRLLRPEPRASEFHLRNPSGYVPFDRL